MKESFGGASFFDKAKEVLNKAKKTAVVAGAITAGVVASEKADAQQMSHAPKTKDTIIVHSTHDPRLKKFEDSAALYKYTKTEKKYLGVQEERPFNEADFTPEEAQYHHDLYQKMHDIVATEAARLDKLYKSGQMSEQAYFAAIDALNKDKANDPRRVEEKFLHQAGVLIDKEQKENIALFGKNDGQKMPTEFTMRSGELFNKHIKPVGEFIDKQGHVHPDYKAPEQAVRYDMNIPETPQTPEDNDY